MKRYILTILALLFSVSFAEAQGITKLCIQTNGKNCIQIDATNPLPVTGSGGGGATNVQGVAASGATATGNTLRDGGVYNTTRPTFTNGQLGDLQIGTRGSLNVTLYGPDSVSPAAIAATDLDGVLGTRQALSVGSFGYSFNGTSFDRIRSDSVTIGSVNVNNVATSSAAGSLALVSTGAAANNLVLKGSAGNLYNVSVTNLTATQGFLVLLNATASPADGAIVPVACAPLPSNGSSSLSFNVVPARFSTGITAVVTSAATCFTKTTGVITAFISGQAL